MGTRFATLALLTLAALPLAQPCPAAEPVTTEEAFTSAVELPRLLAQALADNPEIQAARNRWRAARERPSQEGSLPDPMINTAYHNEGFDDFEQGRSDFAWLRFGAEQEVPFPGKLGLKETVAAREADREGAMLRATILNVAARLRVAYSEYFLAHKSIEIVEKNQAVLATLEKTAQARFAVGEGIQQDVLKAQVELSILLDRLTSLEQKRQSLAAAVNALLNRPPLAPLGDPAPVEKPRLSHALDELETLARQQSPLLQAARAGVAAGESSLSLARRQYYPDFVVRADYFNKAALVPEWEVGAGIRVPLYFWRKQSFGVREAAAMLGEAQAEQQSTVQDLLAGVKDFFAQASAAERLVALYDTTVLPQARLSLNSASAGYAVGKVDFLTVLNNFSVLLEYELRYFEELANFEKAVAQLEEAVGLGPSAALQEVSLR